MRFLIFELKDGWTPLHYAAARGRTEILVYLLDAGADMTWKNSAGQTPFFSAAQFAVGLECAKILCERGAVLDERDNDNITPLIAAAYEGNEEMVRYLLLAGADRNLFDDDDQTAADAAESGGHKILALRLQNDLWPAEDDDHFRKWNDNKLMVLVQSRGVQLLLDAPDTIEVGKGFGGKAYLCNDHGAKVVIKCLSEEQSETDFSRKMLLDEARIMFNLRHPHIVQLLSVSELPLAIVLECAELGSLDSVVERFSIGEIPMSIMLWFGRQVSSGLEYLHSERVLHRDVKAGNVLVFRGFTLKLTDFGFSRAQRNDNTLETTGAGMVSHVAPECFSRKVSFASDIYSLAITLWEIATCRSIPWTRLPQFVIMELVLKGERPPLTMVAEPYRSVIEECWVQDRKLRPKAELVRRRFEALCANNPHTRNQIRAMEDHFYRD